MRALIIVSILCIIRTTRADELSPPSWLLSAGGGLSLDNVPAFDGPGNMLDMGGVAGLVLDARHVGNGYAVYGEVDGFFVGDVYGGRLGVILGGHTSSRYSEVLDITNLGSTTSNGVTTTTYRTTTAVYSDEVRGAWGLDLSASARSFDGGNAFTIEAGIGWLGQHQFELQMTYDLVSGTPGMRVQGLINQGESASWCMRLSFETLFSLDAAPLAGIASLTIGGGPGFHAH